MYLFMEEIWVKMFYFFFSYIENYNVDLYWSNLEMYLVIKWKWILLGLIFVVRVFVKNNILKLYVIFFWKGFKYCYIYCIYLLFRRGLGEVILFF